MKNFKKLLIILTMPFYSYSMLQDTDEIKTNIGRLRVEAKNLKENHAQEIAKIKLRGKRERAVLTGFSGIILSLATAGVYLDKNFPRSPWLRYTNLFFFGTLSTFLIGKTFNNLFSTVQDNGDGTFEVVSPYMKIKRALF